MKKSINTLAWGAIRAAHALRAQLEARVATIEARYETLEKAWYAAMGGLEAVHAGASVDTDRSCRISELMGKMGLVLERRQERLNRLNKAVTSLAEIQSATGRTFTVHRDGTWVRLYDGGDW